MVVTFIYSVAGGMLTVLATGRTDQLSWRFLQIVGLLVLAPVALVSAWAFRQGGAVSVATWLGCGMGVAAMATALTAPLAARCGRLFRAVTAVGGLLGLAAAIASVFRLLGPVESVLVWWMTGVAQILGALVLGSITAAWLLGHAYLTATGMTIAPLRHFSRLLNWAIAIRAVFVLVSLGVAWAAGVGDSGLWASLSQQWFVLSLRLCLGIVALAVFAYMVSDCVRLRATQSATGILYFGAFFAYIGELASQYLLLECGWPV